MSKEKKNEPVNLLPSRQMMKLMWPGPLAAKSMYIAAELGIADFLKDGALQIDVLNKKTETDASFLARLLYALSGIGIFAKNSDGSFRNTELSETLRADHPESVRPWALFLNGPFLWKTLEGLQGSVESGQTAVERIHGKNFWEYLEENPGDAEVFNQAMTAGSDMHIPSILKAYDFSSFETVVDIGGGHGRLLKAILTTHPGLQGLLFDLPSVIADADILQNEVCNNHCEVQGGNFFESIPEGGDLYLLKGIVHDWPDKDALKILKNCRKAIREDGCLLIMELVMEEDSGRPSPVNFMDLLMLTLTGGRERTEIDFRQLLDSSGFALNRIIPTGSPFSIIEAKPV